MATTIQSVMKNIKEVTANLSKKASLHVALMIMTPERKNYASMARSNNLLYQDVYIDKREAEEYLTEAGKFLIELIKDIATEENPGYLLVDFSMLLKQFSEKIPQVTYDYNGVGKVTSKGFSVGFIFWSNGKITIPFDFGLWLRKKDAGDVYKKKTEITIELINIARANNIPFSEVKLDGAFACVEMLAFLEKEKIRHTMRIPSNRKIETAEGAYKLSEHPALKLKGNEKYKTIVASYKGFTRYFTAHKRKGVRGSSEVVYIISAVENRSAKEHVEAYDKRWPAEKCFRTGKQHLGLTHCQSTDATKQRLHIFFAMMSYAILERLKNDNKKKSPEQVLHHLRGQKLMDGLRNYTDLKATFMT
jgi:hypothetical protein